jgi:hypothetical protein
LGTHFSRRLLQFLLEYAGTFMTAWKALCIRACGWKPFEGVRTEDLDYAIAAIRRKPAAPGVPEGLCVILYLARADWNPFGRT